MTIGLVKGNTIVGLNEEATAASGTITVTNNTLDAGDALVINGVTFTNGTEFSPGVDTTATALAIANAINASNNKLVNGVLTASAALAVVTITADVKGTAGNAITLAESDGATNNFTLSGATLTGGAFTEGTYAAPATASDYVQVLEEGLEVNPQKELVERNILTSSIGFVTPRASTKSVSASVPVEYRAQGAEGGVPQYDPLVISALGNRRKLRNRITTGTGHSTTVINVASANTIFQVGDFIVVLQSGAHHECFVTAVASGNITVAPAMDSAPSNGVQLAKTVTYYPANTNHMPLSASVYWGNEILEKATGLKIASMGVENLVTGQVTNLNFSSEGLGFDRINGVAPHTPTYDGGLPPLALSAKIYLDGVCYDLNEFSMSLENTIASLASVKSADGKIASRYSERKITGSVNPYMDDTTVTLFDKFKNNTAFSIFAFIHNVSTTAGEFELGSICGIYLPSCVVTEIPVADVDGILVDSVAFSASTGSDGTGAEIYMGFC